jgi:hypothetical protein
MTQEDHHEELVKGIAEQLKQVMSKSAQGIYIYLDDTHKVCNKKFAKMEGFNSPEEWAKVENPLEVGVEKSSQNAIVSAYKNAMEKLIASKIDVKLKKKNGAIFDASIIMVPLTYQGHLFALHYISPT